MAPTIAQIIRSLEEAAPLYLKEEWDNPGLQVGSLDTKVKKVAFSLDPTYGAVQRALAAGAELLITHHPLFLRGIRSVDVSRGMGRLMKMALKEGLSIYSAHTNLDSAPRGLNQLLAERLGLEDILPLEVSKGPPSAGIGRYGRCSPIAFERFLGHLKAHLSLSSMRFVPPKREYVEHIAVVTGSGGGYVEKAFEKGCDVLVTGDVGHHHFLEAQDLGMGIVDITHHVSEEVPFKEFAFGFVRGLKDDGICVEMYYVEEQDPPFQTWGP